MKYLIPLVILLFTPLLNERLCADEPTKQKALNIDHYPATLVVEWNKHIIDIAVAEDGLLTLKGVRAAAMAHIAMHDVLNAIKPAYKHYAYDETIPDANPIAAATQAAYEVLLAQYPDKHLALNELKAQWLNTVEDGITKAAGISRGKMSAKRILKLRENDQWNSEAEYTWHPMGPGVYAEFNEHSGTPEGFVFGAGWARAKPFMLKSQDHFRAPPPPAINSDDYTVAFNEVKALGGSESTKRTADQTHLAMWWKDFVENSHNRLLRELVIAEEMNLWEATRIFALLNMSVCDAYINVFENKFFYNHWRPYTAIRWAANDENPATIADTSWNNLHKHTYAFPSYPSAHGTASAAAMIVLERYFGENYKFTMTTREVDAAGPFSGKIKMSPATRSFDSFSAAGLECAMSRLYLGIHFRYDSEEGFKLGSRVGNFAFDNFLVKGKHAEK